MTRLLITTLAVALVAPGAVMALKPSLGDHQINLTADKITYSPIKMECVNGLVVARSITTMLQLVNPDTGKPMKCGEKVVADLKVQDEIAVLSIKMKEHEIVLGKLEQEKIRNELKLMELRNKVNELKKR